jgi:hypothetical protein
MGNPDEWIVDTEHLRQLWAADYYKPGAVLYVLIAGYTQAEAAAELGISQAAAGDQVRRFLKRNGLVLSYERRPVIRKLEG